MLQVFFVGSGREEAGKVKISLISPDQSFFQILTINILSVTKPFLNFTHIINASFSPSPILQNSQCPINIISKQFAFILLYAHNYYPVSVISKLFQRAELFFSLRILIQNHSEEFVVKHLNHREK